ncbi:hypothetical protein DW084_11545 [Enterococcus casseliflavus]|uniref:Uncharacterized protein n=1 Tax=Enterococcus casseliflavus TaxID=37734 RepID=A0A415EQZ6_ENTCA|nr:hypothetical protein DW084_11545 [Enterococcus casseliflavus]
MERSKIDPGRFFSGQKAATKGTLKHQYHYYRQQNAHQAFNSDFQRNFQQDFPNFATWLKLQQQTPQKNQTATFSHWLLVGFFGLLTAASFSQQLLFLLFVFVLAALVKGPGMIVWGIVYSFLVSLFPPLGIVLSGLFFLLTLRQLTKNVTFVLTALYFYGYPFVITALQHFTNWDPQWLWVGSIGFALISGHFVLKQNYPFASSKSLAWAIISVPYDCVMALIPVKHKARFKRLVKIK